MLLSTLFSSFMIIGLITLATVHMVFLVLTENTEGIYFKISITFCILTLFFQLLLLMIAVIKSHKVINPENISWMNAADWTGAFWVTICILLMVTMLKKIQFLFWRTASSARIAIRQWEVVLVILILIIFIYSFAIAGYIIFGSYSKHFRSISNSFLILSSIIPGHFYRNLDFRAISNIPLNIGRIYFVVFIFGKFILIFLLISVLITSYKRTVMMLRSVSQNRVQMTSKPTKLRAREDKLNRCGCPTSWNSKQPLDDTYQNYLLLQILLHVIHDMIDKHYLGANKEYFLHIISLTLECLILQEYCGTKIFVRDGAYQEKPNAHRKDDIRTIIQYLINKDGCDNINVLGPMYSLHERHRNTAVKLNVELEKTITTLGEIIKNIERCYCL